jgi:hypothetical protein
MQRYKDFPGSFVMCVFIHSFFLSPTSFYLTRLGVEGVFIH